MQLGIFAKTFGRASLEEVLGAVAASGFSTIQFNFASAGLASLPERIEGATMDWIGGCLDAYELSVAAVSGTFNMAHPDRSIRERGLRGLETVAQHCALLGTKVITLCTGTRDPGDMWRKHPENDTEGAWVDLAATLERALTIADRYHVTLAFEPEHGNVINSATKAKRLIDTFATPLLGVVLDPANLPGAADSNRSRTTIGEAVEMLGPSVCLAHAKDLNAKGESGTVVPGDGVLDFAYFFAQLDRVKFRGPVVTHGFAEAAAPRARLFLQQKLDEVNARSRSREGRAQEERSDSAPHF